MKNLPIRIKLTLLAGIPVLGALLLALQIVADARMQVQKNKSLGTIEHVAQLSEAMGRLVSELQKERAFAARFQGRLAEATKTGDSGRAAPAESAASDAAAEVKEPFARQSVVTAEASAHLNRLVTTRDVERLPDRLAADVRDATASLEQLAAHRTQVTQKTMDLTKVLEKYDRPIRALTEGIAALSELTDNGELLRLTTSLVSVLQFKERASQEHALLAYVFEVGSFPPGSYRSFVTLTTEEAVYIDAFKTTASYEQVQLYQRAITKDVADRTKRIRTVALESTEDGFAVDPDEWFRVQQEKLTQIGAVERELHSRVGAVAQQRILETRKAEWTSAALVIVVIIVVVVMAWVIARGITRRVTALRHVAELVGQGNLAIRVDVTSKDELGALGSAFNEMISEIGSARMALGNQIRMARELEIAASLQQAILPPSPAHSDFEFAGRMQPADEVGGDFYDVLRTGVSDMWVTIGDVSGHGLEAGLVMLMTQSAFASQFRASPKARPSDTIRNVNHLLCENIAERLKDKKYVTAQIFAYRGDGRFALAGAHQPTIIYRASQKRCEVLEISGPWLGIDPTVTEIPEQELQLDPGDILCLYTDGLSEARNEQGELFDLPRLVDLISTTAASSDDVDAIADTVFRVIGQHAHIHDDDWTMLLVRRRVGTN
ncbi:MAG TPA: SpoIIE family protein phosphatase [Polyangiaceae bacterium]|nr:SpoIIE family protein phosphatase [Polyangiaceae bacterium]